MNGKYHNFRIKIQDNRYYCFKKNSLIGAAAHLSGIFIIKISHNRINPITDNKCVKI